MLTGINLSSGGPEPLLSLNLIPSHLLSAFPDDPHPSRTQRVFCREWGHVGLSVFPNQRISAVWGYPGSAAVFVPPSEQPAATSAETAWEPPLRSLCWWNKTVQACLEQVIKAVSFPLLLGIMGIIISLFLQPPQLPEKE